MNRDDRKRQKKRRREKKKDRSSVIRHPQRDQYVAVSAPVPIPVSVAVPLIPVSGAVNVGNVAAALDPASHRKAAAPVAISDTFPYDVAFNMAFLGSGQGGARLASSFYQLGYRRVGLFNTAESDFQGLPEDIHRHTLQLGGAAKDARFAEQSLNGHEHNCPVISRTRSTG